MVPKDSIDPSNGHLNVAYALAMGEKALWREGVGSFLSSWSHLLSQVVRTKGMEMQPAANVSSYQGS